ncbi:MAG: CDP-alcohol phosphatidyltransferase family protein [Proteobacteria bacterium]|nr:CDP-alcohol phosphatidyltransferase family protein [Pseudomonadota bacterium]
MLDRTLQPLVVSILDVPGRMLGARGVESDWITLGGFVLGLAGAAAIALGAYDAALVLILLNRLADGLDGAVARASGVSDFGRYLDIVFNFIFYAAFALGFAFADPELALTSAILIFSFLGLGGTVLAYAIVAQGAGLEADAAGNLWVDSLSELVGTSETTLALILMALLPAYFGAIALVFALLCMVTTVFRIVRAWLVLR